jgi:hypothetical protein
VDAALLVPVLYVNQVVLRLGAVSGVGHARLILERFGRFWGAFSVIDLFLLNALAIVTEFIGMSPALKRRMLALPHSRRECDGFPIALALGHHGPHHSCDLVSERGTRVRARQSHHGRNLTTASCATSGRGTTAAAPSLRPGEQPCKG